MHEDIRDAFIDATRKALKKLYGDPSQIAGNVDYCRMVNRAHFDRVTGLIEDATARGARITVGGDTAVEDNFITPTVIVDVPDTARIMREEIFGPVLPVLTYRDSDEVITAVNKGPKPLALYIYAHDDAVIEGIISRTSAGGTCVNTALVQYLHGNLPFGGVNNSGIGNAHGYWGFKAFSHERAVVRDRFAATSLFMPPYNRFTRWFIRFAEHIS